MRKRTSKGSINLNTNGSLTGKALNVVDAGLDCIRISMNSVRPELYHAYYRPKGYTFEDVVRTISSCVERNVYTMINYLIFPGITDQEDEMTALFRLIRETGVNFIHFKNLCMDPFWYLSSMKNRGNSPPMGIREAARRIKREFPQVEIGYFNQPGFRVKRTTAE
jgi:molybdenum cofactor biosynthesis enzyme MoaA